MAKKAQGGNAPAKHDGAAHLGRGEKRPVGAPSRTYATAMPVANTAAGVSVFNGRSGAGGAAVPKKVKGAPTHDYGNALASGKAAGGVANVKASPRKMRATPFSAPMSGTAHSRPAAAARANGVSVPKRVTKSQKGA